MKSRIAVYLSSKSALPESYRRAAEEVGAWIGRTGRTLVYGGARAGLMEVLAQATAKAGGHVVGVVPQILIDRNMVSDACHTSFYTADLADRKATMQRESDICIALPGGLGTLDEVFTVLAATTIGTSQQPVVLYNVDGCWDTLLRCLDDLTQRGLITPRPETTLLVASTIEELERICG